MSWARNGLSSIVILHNADKPLRLLPPPAKSRQAAIRSRLFALSMQTPLNRPRRASQPSPTGSPRFLHAAHT